MDLKKEIKNENFKGFRYFRSSRVKQKSLLQKAYIALNANPLHLRDIRSTQNTQNMHLNDLNNLNNLTNNTSLKYQNAPNKIQNKINGK